MYDLNKTRKERANQKQSQRWKKTNLQELKTAGNEAAAAVVAEEEYMGLARIEKERGREDCLRNEKKKGVFLIS